MKRFFLSLYFKHKKFQCNICRGDCLIKNIPSGWNTYIATHQPIIKLRTLKRILPLPIIGPDTLLATWQYYHQQKDWEQSDAVRDIGKKLGFTVAFCQDHYEVHVTGKSYEAHFEDRVVYAT